MLGEVEKLKGGKEVLGPDGKAIKSPAEQQAMMKAKIDEYRKQKIAELSARMKNLSESNADYAGCLSLLREANCLINLAFSEMASIEGVDDELLGFSDEFFRHVTRSDSSDQLEDLITRIEKNVLKFLHHKRWEYKNLMVKRRPALLALTKLNPEKVPVVLTKPLFDLGVNVPFMNMGRVHLFFPGGFESTEDAALCVYNRLTKVGYNCIMLASATEGDSFIPEKWWAEFCNEQKTVKEVLDPLLKNEREAQILIVSSLDKTLGEEKRKDVSPKTRQQALLRIARWCLSNQMLGLVFSEGSAESRPWLGTGITLVKGACHVDSGGVQDVGKPEVVGDGADRTGQKAEGSGEDQGGSAGQGNEADGGGRA